MANELMMEALMEKRRRRADAQPCPHGCGRDDFDSLAAYLQHPCVAEAKR